MSEATRQRLFDPSLTVEDPTTCAMVLGACGLLVVSGLVLAALIRSGRVGDTKRRELWARWRTWIWLCLGLLAPLALGAAWFVGGVVVLSLLCYREYARATGLFREKRLSAAIVLGILVQGFAVLDHWYHFFVALTPIVVCFLAAVAVTSDRPKGYIQRVALAVLGYLLFGAGLLHLAYLGNDVAYRKIVIWLFSAVALGDVFAYITGHLFGRRPLAPNTSPNKTLEGAMGGIVLTTAYTVGLGFVVFEGTPMGAVGPLVFAGVLLSTAGLLGDLVLSSIKRDLGLKDLGTALPGHGGWLDRFDSLVLSVPAAFHLLYYVMDLGAADTRIFTGGG